MMQNIFGVVVLYYPASTYQQNIQSYLHFVDRLLILDNSEHKTRLPEELIANSKIGIHQNGVNKGIAASLNIAAKMAISEGYQWMLTMDQDSFFEPAEIERYSNCFHNSLSKQSVAQFGVEYESKKDDDECDETETTYLITSGSLVNLDILKTIGDFDENLFIDEVDSEYCLRANIYGYRTIKFNNVFLNHSLGTIGQFRSFKNLKATPRTLHSPIRIYYMVRNFLYVKKKYGSKLPETFPKRRGAIINRIKNNLLYGNERLRVLKFIFDALMDYKKGRMGKK